MKTTLIPLLMLIIAVAVSAQNYNSADRRPEFSDWSTPVNLGAPVNSGANDASAVLSKDGLSLYFSSDRSGFGGEDIFVSKRRSKNARWQESVNLGAVVNSASTDRLRSISTDGRILLFQSNRVAGGQGGNDIWASVRSRVNDDFAWSTPVNLGSVINTEKEEIAANYWFGNGDRRKKLFFSSSRPGGINNSADIYLSEISSGENFETPVNILELNSPYTESCFWVRDDGLEIIFSSTRAAFNNLIDSFDLWVSTRASIDDNWSVPESLATLNTQGFRDVNPQVSADWQTMYFTSNRQPGGFGGSDIYLTTRHRLRGNE